MKLHPFIQVNYIQIMHILQVLTIQFIKCYKLLGEEIN